MWADGARINLQVISSCPMIASELGMKLMNEWEKDSYSFIAMAKMVMVKTVLQRLELLAQILIPPCSSPSVSKSS